MTNTTKGYTVTSKTHEAEFRTGYGKTFFHCFPIDGIGSAFQAAKLASEISGVAIKHLRVTVHH